MVDAKKYPEHANLKQVKEKTQFAHDFLQFLEDKGYSLITHDGNVGLSRGQRDEFMFEFIGGNKQKFEDEKVAMLDECQQTPKAEVTKK